MAKRGRPIKPDSPHHHELFKTHQQMRLRCNNPNNPSYHNYGKRGIKVCKRWDSYAPGFKNFLEDMGPRPEGHTLERKNNEKGYYKRNCKWATRSEQSANKRTNRISGISIRAISTAVGVEASAVYHRLNIGLPLSQALDITPLKKGPPPQKSYTIDGITSSIGAHAKRIGCVSENLAHYRLSRGWTPEEAVKRPTRRS